MTERPGWWEAFRGVVIKDHKKYGFLDLPGILRNSSNIGIAKVAQRLGPQVFHRYASRFGFGLRMGYEITEYWSQSLRYILRRDTIEDVDGDASIFVRAQEGSAITSMIGQAITFDRRNNRLEPTEGFVTKLSTDVAGIGGDARYLRAKLNGSHLSSLLRISS